jgi:TorA maturation chaperone TorD
MAETEPAWPQPLREALADDLDTLVLLQDRELTAELLAALEPIGFPDNLGLVPATEGARQAWALAREAVASLPELPAAETLDLLAADYAAIYLNGSFGASPCESVWLSDEHVACDAPMFELRALYAAHGLQAADWRRRPDDHLLLQLQFVARRLRAGGGAAELAELASLLDEHLLRWLGEFAVCVAARCDTALYAGLVSLTFAYVEDLRERLAIALGADRPSAEEVEQRYRARRPQEGALPVRFMPGAAASW